MNREDFDQLVERLEKQSAAYPRWFVWKVVAWALGGFGYLFLVLLLALLLTVGCVVMMITVPNALTLKLGLVLLALFGGMGWAILRSLWVRTEAPEGVRLTRKDVPGLFALTDGLRSKLKSAPFHEVMLTGDFNAAVSQVPRLGVFGWQKNYLVLGLPLLQSLPPTEFEAVLVHEFAHLSGNHGRLGTWLYRLRRSWQNVFENLARQESGGASVLQKFIGWYWPRFNAHAFVLSRAQEYEADALAASHAGAENIAAALTRISVYDRHLDEAFWSEIGREAARQPAPPDNIYERLPELLRSGPSREHLAEWLKQSFLMDTTNNDTHPCLRDRLLAVGQLPAGVKDGVFPSALPPLSSGTAAEAFLGSGQASLTHQLGMLWAKNAQATWQHRHQEAEKARKELAALDAEGSKAGDAEAEPVERKVERLWKRSLAIRTSEGDAAALPLLKEVLALSPAHPGANFLVGADMLERDESSGTGHIEQAISGDPELAGPGLGVLGAYYHRNGMKDQRRQIEDRMERLADEEAEFYRERASATAADEFIPHGLSEGEMESLRRLLASEAVVLDAVVAKKQVKKHPQKPMRVIGITIKVPWWKFRSSTANSELVDRLLKGVELEGYFLIFVREKNLKALGNKIAKVPGALVYERAR